MRKFSIIFVNNQIHNIYINTGSYVEKVAQEMRDSSYGEVRVQNYETTLTDEELLKLLDVKNIMTTWKTIYKVNDKSELTEESLIEMFKHYYEIDLNNCVMSHERWIEELVKAMKHENYLDEFLEAYDEYLSAINS
jgi:HD superfamily phosphohydrolase